MNVLVLGGGGREHAICDALSRSAGLGRLICAPGNAGVAGVAECHPLAIIDPAAVVAFARAEGVGLVVVGPEAPLVAGVADALRAAGVPVVGPSAAAARLEGSKAFTKGVCDAAGVPTAAYASFDEAAAARAYVLAGPPAIVVKADGLAAGKGVTVAATHAEALEAVDALFADGPARVVIEECMVGEEVSFFVACDGEVAVPLGSAQDHKRVGEGDTGPNTGGMGAYSPAAVFTPELEARTVATIIAPTLAEMARRGTPYQGILFAGLMLTARGPKLIEYNCRFGDPEAEVILPRLRSDALALFLAIATGRLVEIEPAWDPRAALTVVMAARGYPGTPETGGAIEGLAEAEAEGARVFHAGTRSAGGRIVAAGGRVLAVTGMGGTVAAAAAEAYGAVEKIRWREGFFRRDIGWRAIARDKGRTA